MAMYNRRDPEIKLINNSKMKIQISYSYSFKLSTYSKVPALSPVPILRTPLPGQDDKTE